MFIWPGPPSLCYEHVKIFHPVFKAARKMRLLITPPVKGKIHKPWRLLYYSHVDYSNMIVALQQQRPISWTWAQKSQSSHCEYMLNFKIQFQKGKGQIVTSHLFYIYIYILILRNKVCHAFLRLHTAICHCYTSFKLLITNNNIKCVASVYTSNKLK